MKYSKPINRHVRALRILNCLQSGPQYSAKDLARIFEVSRRTIYRDLELLRAAGVQVYYDEEEDAYALINKQPPLPTFHMEDVTMLALSASLSMLSSWPRMESATREIVSKLLSNYPQRVRGPASRLITTCRPHTGASEQTHIADEMLSVLFRAVQQRKRVRVCFIRDGEFRRTKMSPYRIILGRGRWKLIGRSSWHRRTEVLDSEEVQSIEITEDPYTIPRNFRFRRVDPNWD